ncbi:MAG: DMT family transporter [Candidatus Hydrogenedentes bacterium]|nr:DMT family transporter [Candidatus Hydrogenedentota bacterium]
MSNETDRAAGSAVGSRMLWFFFLLALTNLMWAAQGTAVKFLSRHLGPIAITFLPFYVATLLLVPLLIWKRRSNPGAVRPTWADWKQFVAAGVAGQVLAQLGMTWGIALSLASNGAILNLLIPVITAVLASIMLRERLTLLRMSCLGIGLLGVLLMSVQDLKQSSFLAGTYLVGNLLIFGGCTGSAFYNVYCKGLLRRFQEVEILIFSYVTASLASLPLLWWREPGAIAALAQMDWQSWAAFAFLAIFMYGVSMLLFFYVLQYLPVTVASASLYLVPVFGVLMAVTILHERLSAPAIAGTAIVLASTIIIMRYDPIK